MRRIVLVSLSILLPLLILELLSVKHAAAFSILISALILWISQLMPLWVTAILIPVLSIIFGVLDVNQAFASFGSNILGLFVGTFLIVRAIQKLGLDRRIADILLSSPVIAKTPIRIITGFTLLAWFMGMWMSNTATCAFLLPIALGLINKVGERLDTNSSARFSVRLLLTCAFTPSIGGMSTPVGSVPNAVAIHYLSTHGIGIRFTEWLVFALPVSFLLLLVSFSILAFLYPIDNKPIDFTSVAHESPGRWTPPVIYLIMIIFLVLTGWIMPGIFPAISRYLPLALPPLLGAILLFLFPANPILESKDVKEIDWGTILLFGGGLCLGKILDLSGAARVLSENFVSGFSDSDLFLPFAVTAASAVLSEIGSNTATASVLVPIIHSYTAAIQAGTTLVMGSVLACGLGFMMPVSTPPNAMVFASGHISLKQMMIAGILLDIIGIVVISGYLLLQ